MTDAPAREWLTDRAGHEGQTGLELDDFIEGRAVFVGAGEVAFQCQINQAGVQGRELLVAAAEAFHRAGAVVFQHHDRWWAPGGG